LPLRKILTLIEKIQLAMQKHWWWMGLPRDTRPEVADQRYNQQLPKGQESES